jgi:peptidoglycan/LPS O-acetylase OafA/YrhL
MLILLKALGWSPQRKSPARDCAGQEKDSWLELCKSHSMTDQTMTINKEIEPLTAFNGTLLEVSIKQRFRLDYLDGLRGLAAVYVVMSHVRMFSRSLTIDDDGFMDIFRYGHQAVAIFLMISGFSLTLPLIKAWNEGRKWDGAADFYKRRVKRILPTYYISVAVTLALIHFHAFHGYGPWPDLSHLTVGGIVTHLLLVNNVYFGPNCMKWGSVEINDVYWSLAVECQVYLVFPLIVWAWKKIGPMTTLLLASCWAWFYINYLNLETFGQFQLWGTNGHFLAIFVLGMIAAWIAYSKEALPSLLRTQVPWALIFVLSCVRFVFVNIDQDSPKLQLIDIETCLTIGLPLLIGASATPWLGEVFGFRLFRWLGTFSYSLYICHLPIMLMVAEHFILPHKGMYFRVAGWATILCLPLCVLGSYLFYLVAERPFLNRPQPIPRETVLNQS